VEAQQSPPGTVNPPGTVAPLAPPNRPMPYPPPAGYQGWPGGPAPLPPGRSSKPPRPSIWLIILRSWLVRRLITLGIVLLVLYIAYEHFFGSDSSNNPAALHPGAIQGSGRLATNPQDAVAAVYHLTGENSPRLACEEFSTAGQIEFAHDIGATDCMAAITKIHSQLGQDGQPAYDDVLVPDSAVTRVGNATEISSCGMTITAGPRLGVFVLTEDQFHEWQITGHRTEPDPCPTPPTTTASTPPTS
jgi:hypothetical protein